MLVSLAWRVQWQLIRVVAEERIACKELSQRCGHVEDACLPRRAFLCGTVASDSWGDILHCDVRSHKSCFKVESFGGFEMDGI